MLKFKRTSRGRVLYAGRNSVNGRLKLKTQDTRQPSMSITYMQNNTLQWPSNEWNNSLEWNNVKTYNI